MATKKLAKPPAKVQKGRAKIAAPKAAKITKKVKAKVEPKPLTASEKLDAIGIGAICEKVAECVFYEDIATAAGVSRYALMGWLRANETMYAPAREARAHKLAEDILEIADEITIEAKYQGDDVTLDVSSAAVSRNKLRVDTRKWLASKMLPKIYGDRTTLAGDAENPLAVLTMEQIAANPASRLKIK